LPKQLFQYKIFENKRQKVGDIENIKFWLGVQMPHCTPSGYATAILRQLYDFEAPIAKTFFK
jgi:hypothetical protein